MQRQLGAAKTSDTRSTPGLARAGRLSPVCEGLRSTVTGTGPTSHPDWAVLLQRVNVVGDSSAPRRV